MYIIVLYSNNEISFLLIVKIWKLLERCIPNSIQVLNLIQIEIFN